MTETVSIRILKGEIAFPSFLNDAKLLNKISLEKLDVFIRNSLIFTYHICV
ncbi:MAG: hypothetical protein FWH37_04605 [Candidatus Bathyarchaeota archaeon]|nr:hypothetical protein [Candidatus Termiticorpusculum sp.]